jgi:hypothetical protein
VAWPSEGVVNRERFAAVLAHIEANPEQWDQSEWCGSSCCFAGHTAAMFGLGARVFETEYSFDVEDNADYFKVQAIVQSLATKALELSDSEAYWLFGGMRSVDDFRQFLATDGACAR